MEFIPTSLMLAASTRRPDRHHETALVRPLSRLVPFVAASEPKRQREGIRTGFRGEKKRSESVRSCQICRTMPRD